MSTLIKGSPHFSSPYSPTGETDQVPEHLFRLDPSLRALFTRTDFVRQRRMLLNMIGVTVRGLDRLDGVVPTLRDLGRRHVGYGVRPEHLSLSRLNHWLPRGQADPEVMQGTADFHH